MTFKQKNKWIYILANLFKGFYINLIGSISATELFVLFRIPHLIGWLKKIHSPELKHITTLYSFLLTFQIIAEVVVGNSFVNALKGIMVTVMSYFVFVFYFELLMKDIRIIKWGPIAAIASLIIFGDQFGYAETGESTYFKFYFAPIIINGVMFLILSRKTWVRRNIIIITGGLSLFVIAGGARGLGFSLLFAMIAYYLFNRYKTISLKKILPSLIVGVILFQLFYASIYVPNVVSGKWGSDQNREQLTRINNSKNILMMVFAARTDFFVSWQAFMDKPLWGHGAWATDENLKYTKLLASLSNIDLNEDSNDFLIPVHSVIVAMGTQNGIFKFITFLILFIYIYRLGIKSLNKQIPDEYNFYLIYIWISSFQHLMFGPPAVLKTTGSFAFAIFLAFYLLKKESHKNEVQISHNHSNLQIRY